jgi:hypothetical protein
MGFEEGGVAQQQCNSWNIISNASAEKRFPFISITDHKKPHTWIFDRV